MTSVPAQAPSRGSTCRAAPACASIRICAPVTPIPPTYDSLMAKLIVWGDTREEAIARGKRALDEFVIEGVATTIPFHRRVLDNATFNSGMVYTDFIETETNGGQL